MCLHYQLRLVIMTYPVGWAVKNNTVCVHVSTLFQCLPVFYPDIAHTIKKVNTDYVYFWLLSYSLLHSEPAESLGHLIFLFAY